MTADAPNCLKSGIADDAPGITPLYPWLRCEHCIGSTQHTVTGHIVGTNRTLLRCSQCGKVREDVLAVAHHAQLAVAEQHADTEPAPSTSESELTPAQEQIARNALYELNCRRLLALGDYLAEHYRGEYRAGEFMTEQAARLLTQQRAELAEVTAAHAQALVTIAELRRENAKLLKLAGGMP